jgi:hypothetical protein
MVEMLGDAPGTQAGAPTVFPLIAILASLFGPLAPCSKPGGFLPTH